MSATEEIIASWTPVIVRGATYQKTLSITDEDGDPVSYSSAQIDVIPNDAAAFSWTQASGNFTFVSTGVYSLTLTPAEATALVWSSGTYHLNVVESSGAVNPCLISGLIFCEDC